MAGQKKSNHQVVAGFEQAREWFLEMQQRGDAGSREDRKVLTEILGENLRNDLRDSGKNLDQFYPQKQKRLIRSQEFFKLREFRKQNENYIENSDQVYRVIADLAQQESEYLKDLRASYSGDYEYVRYHALTAASPRELVRGKLKLHPSALGSMVFEHWSHDWAAAEPEHTGWVFLMRGKMFMLATRPGVLRLAIADAPPGHKPDEHGMRALVLSVRTGTTADWKDPFAAKAIIFKAGCRELIEYDSASDEERIAMFKKLVATDKGKRGEDEFAGFPFLSL